MPRLIERSGADMKHTNRGGSQMKRTLDMDTVGAAGFLCVFICSMLFFLAGCGNNPGDIAGSPSNSIEVIISVSPRMEICDYVWVGDGTGIIGIIQAAWRDTLTTTEGAVLVAKWRGICGTTGEERDTSFIAAQGVEYIVMHGKAAR